MMTQLDQSSLNTKTIPIIVDKSHLITIGEKLYTDKISFVRELVNNAFDADATEVYVTVGQGEVSVRDNGSGMDEAGLHQYFTIGSGMKKEHDMSPVYNRARIGEFGIGKFAALAACKQFCVETQRGDFRARLIFDKEVWSKHEDWHLDIEILQKVPAVGDGTTITLLGVDIPLPLPKIRRYLAERAPIQNPNFAVFLNHERVTSEIVSGQQLPFEIKTPFGLVTGKIIITPANYKNPQLGLAVQVKGVTIRWETFGLETSRKAGTPRLTGIVRADFLPISSNRDDFIRDTPEFLHFTDVVKKQLAKALDKVRQQADERANAQASEVLKEALSKIGRIIRLHKDLFPDTQVPIGDTISSGVTNSSSGYEVSRAEFLPSQQDLDPGLQSQLNDPAKPKPKKRSVGILGNKSVIRNLKVANLDIAVRMEHLPGEDESLVSGGVIYINMSHPLYRAYVGKDELLTQHVVRIVTKELTLKTGVRDAEQAFALQSNMLVDAFREK